MRGSDVASARLRPEPSQRLTSTQREALEWLKAKRDACPVERQSYGFNPPNGRTRLSSSMRRSLAERGFVEIQRVSDQHFRYEITGAGRAALLGTLADATKESPTPMPKEGSGDE